MTLEERFFRYRDDFPFLFEKKDPPIYLDSAATTQKPKVVLDALEEFYREDYATVHRAVYKKAVSSTEKYEKVRYLIQDFIHAESEKEIIFTKGATEGINLVAFSFFEEFVREGDEIIISAMEHHANIVPWQLACFRKKAILRIVPFNQDGLFDKEAYRRMLSKKTKLVAVVHVSNVFGTVNPVREIIEDAHAVGAKVLVDGAQAVLHEKINVQELNADFYVFSGHKMLGPTGVGILYGKKALLDAMPPYQSGGDMIDKVTFEKTTYNELPLKFEAGTPMIGSVIGLGAAVRYIQKIGVDQIQAFEKMLIKGVIEELEAISGVRVFASEQKDRAPIITFTVAGVHPLDIATLLDLDNIAVRSGHLCTQPIMERFGVTGAVRISCALYNTTEELFFCIEQLKKIIKQVR